MPAIRRADETSPQCGNQNFVWLNEGHRKELISDRMDVSTDTLEKHYDARTEREKRQLREEAFGMAEGD